MNIMEEMESEVRSYCRRFPEVFDRADGSYLFTADNKAYLDFFDGAGALNYGHNNQYIMDQVINYIQRKGITHGLDLSTTAKAEFLETFRSEVLLPRGLDHKVMFCGSTGTNAVEAALKLARKVTGRDTIFAFSGAYHGMSLGSLSVTSENNSRQRLKGSLSAVTFMPFPYGFNTSFDTIAYIRNILEDDHSGVDLPAAIILETVQAEGGVIIAPEQWLYDLRVLCDEYHILLICDDIQVGCGRTGTFFSFERAGIVPDIIALSKSISGAGFPMSILLIRPQIDLFEPGEHNGTFRGNQLAFVAGKAALEYTRENDLFAQVKRKEQFVKDYLEKEICQIDNRLLIRGIGLIWGIEFGIIDSRLGRIVSQKCFEDGVVIECAGRKDSVLKIMPALTISYEDLHRGLQVIKDAVIHVLQHNLTDKDN